MNIACMRLCEPDQRDKATAVQAEFDQKWVLSVTARKGLQTSKKEGRRRVGGRGRRQSSSGWALLEIAG